MATDDKHELAAENDEIDAEDEKARDHAVMSAVFVKDLKETAGADSDSSSSDDEDDTVQLNGHAQHDDVHVTHKHHKKHVERRFHRNVLWGSIAWFLAGGRLLSRLGIKGAHIGALRRVCAMSGGFSRATLPDVLFFKARIAGVKCRVYRPADQAEGTKLPVCIYIHGGGWVMCTARTYHAFTLEFCRDIKCVVVSIDYRLAPEHPYPVPLDDCIGVTRAILSADENPIEAGPQLAGWVDVKKVIIAGDSAGGNLSCATALELIRSNDLENRLYATVLICPSVQAISTGFESHRKYGRHSTARSGWFLSLYAGHNDPKPSIVSACKHGRHIPAEFLAKFNEKYLTNWATEGNKTPLEVPTNLDKLNIDAVPEEVTRLALSPRAWPMLARDEDLAKLPPTLVQTCSDDTLKDEGRVFFERLQQVGVDVRYCYLPRAQHCEPIFHKTIPTKAARLGYQQICDFIRDVLARRPKGLGKKASKSDLLSKQTTKSTSS